MKDTKRDALDVLIDFFVEYSKDNVKPKNCKLAQYCGECWQDKDCSKCREQLREYATEEADISDGWDVVKGLYYSFANLQGHNAMTLTLAGQLKDKLEQAGIEVE